MIKLLRNTFAEPEYVSTVDPQISRLLLNLPAVSSRISRWSYGVESGVTVGRASPPVNRAIDRTTIGPDGIEVVWRMRWYLNQVCLEMPFLTTLVMGWRYGKLIEMGCD